MKVDQQTYDIIGAALEVHKSFGPQCSIGFQPVFARISRPFRQSEVIADEQARGVQPGQAGSLCYIAERPHSAT